MEIYFPPSFCDAQLIYPMIDSYPMGTSSDALDSSVISICFFSLLHSYTPWRIVGRVYVC